MKFAFDAVLYFIYFQRCGLSAQVTLPYCHSDSVTFELAQRRSWASQNLRKKRNVNTSEQIERK